MTEPLAYARTYRDRFVEELIDLLRIPSVSTLPEHAADVARAADWLAAHLRGLGLANVEVIPTPRHPMVYAEWLGAPGRPTVLCYGHYDVQPPDPPEEWVTPPFAPAIRDGNLYARGASDDKGQTFVIVKAVESWLRAAGRLPVNVKFLIEGEEEIGSQGITRYVIDHASRLACDCTLVLDAPQYAPGHPAVYTGMRGNVHVEIDAGGAATDLHSGLYGGAAPNPLTALARIVAETLDRSGRIQIPGFCDRVRPPSPEERRTWDALTFDEAALCRELGCEALAGEEGYGVLDRLWARPTFEVHGFVGGFTGAGSKTVIPARATVKISTRLVPDQDPEECARLLEAHVKRIAPKGVRVRVRILSKSRPAVVDPSGPGIRAAAAAMAETFGRAPAFIRSGGSIPIIAVFTDALRVPSVVTGSGLPDDNFHAPNEKLGVENFHKGVEAIIRFFDHLGRG